MKEPKLYTAYQHFNKALFEGDLPADIVLLLGRLQQEYFGMTVPEAWRNSNGQLVHEITLNSNHIREQIGAVLFYGVLIHEMIHLWHRVKIGEEKPPHNENFLKKCEELDLEVVFHQGDSCVTAPKKSGKSFQAIVSLPDEAIYDIECVAPWAPTSPGQDIPSGGDGGSSESDGKSGDSDGGGESQQKRIVVTQDTSDNEQAKEVIIVEGRKEKEDEKKKTAPTESEYDRYVCPVCGVSAFINTTKPVALWCLMCNSCLIKEAK